MIEMLLTLAIFETAFVICYESQFTSAEMIKVNKCCKKNEVLDSDGNTCVVPENTTSDSDWFPYGAVENASGTGEVEIDPQYGGRKQCKFHPGRTLSWKEDDRELEYKLDRNLSLKEFYCKRSKLGLRAVIPPSEYCVDSTDEPKRYVAKFCPCDIFPCIRKCCLPGHVFSLTQGMCVPKAKKDFQYELQFYEITEPLTGQKPSHYMYHSFPKCRLIGNKLLNRKTRGKYNFFVQANGSVLIPMKTARFSLESHEYCVDQVLHEDNATDTDLILCKDSEIIHRITRERSISSCSGVLYDDQFISLSFAIISTLRSLHMIIQEKI